MKCASSLSATLSPPVPAIRPAAPTLLSQLLRPALPILLALLSLPAAAQTGQWTWMGGSDKPTCGTGNDKYFCSVPPVYGALGTPAATNVPSGRYGAQGWTDSAGNLWLFGGNGAWFYGTNGAPIPMAPGYFNDLWEFSPSTREWTWKGGASLPECGPKVSDDYACGIPGVYGPGGPTPGAISGSRYNAVAWSDQSNNLWLFGGTAYITGPDGWSDQIWGPVMGDLWEFNPLTGEWGWMAGSDSVLVCSSLTGAYICPMSGNYGTLGVSSGGFPGNRSLGATWTDSKGNLWMFGGVGLDGGSGGLSYGHPPPAATSGELNDIWEFDLATQGWTWWGGARFITCTDGSLNWSVCGVAPVNGTLGVPAAGNTPGGRDSAARWVDGSGNLWIFAGNGVNGAAGTPGAPNDLWEFNTSTQEWTWMSGNNSANAPNSNSYPGVYGTLGVPAAANVPGSRSNAVTWIDARGRLYLFGGSGIDSVGTGGNLNDLWRFDPATREWAWMSGSKTTPWGENGNTGVYGTFGIPSAGNHPGGRHYANSWTDTNGNFWLFGGLGSAADIVLISGSEAGDMLNDLWEYQPTDAPSPAAAPLFSVTAGTYASTQTVTLSDVMPSAAIFYTLDGTTPTAGSTPYTTALTIADTTTVKSIAIAGNFADSSIASATYTIHLPQAITFTPLPSPVTYGVKAATLSATSTSGLGVSFSLVSGPAKVISSRLYIQGAGTVVVAANQSGGPHYSAAPQVTQTITVHQATLTVSANNRSMTYGGAVPALTYAMTGFVDDDNAYWATSGAPSLSTTVLSSSPAGAYAIAIQAGSLSAANYTFKFDPGTLTVKTATLTISANNRSMTYGAIVPALTYSIGGFVNGDTQATAAKGAPTLETTATSSSPVGSYPISIAAGTLTSSNYSFRFFSGTLTLDKARLTVSANNLTMVQGAAVPALTYSMTGFVNHETQSKATTGQPALSTAATSKSTPATYPIAVKPGTLAAGNYVFSFANGTLTVTK